MITKIIFSVLFVMTILISKAQTVDVPHTQVPVIIKVTATWCPTCGGWGWDFFENLYEDNSEKTVIFADHYSGNYQNNTAKNLASNFNSVGQPVFFLNGKDENVTSSNRNSKRNYFSNQINSIIQQSPDVQTGIRATYANNMLKIEYSTKFFTALTGEYYLGLYPIEKSVIGYQASRGQNADHRNVLREELTGNPFGNLIDNGHINANTVYNGNLEIHLGNYNPENLEIATIIWKKEGSKYKIVNSNIDKNVEKNILSNNNEELSEKNNIKIFPTIIKNHFDKVTIANDKSIENIKIELFDTIGKKIKTMVLNKLYKGNRALNITNSIPGIYYLKISQNGKTIKISKIIFL